MLNVLIKKLICYGIEHNLIEKEDITYTINQLLELFQAENYTEPYESVSNIDLEFVLNGLLDYALEVGLIKENGIVHRDLFDTKIMSVLVPKPSVVINEFWNRYQESPKQATDFYYNLSQDSDYIRRYRIAKDAKWVTHTEYGDLDITINLSKPEKDPKSIAAARNAKQSGYPKCLLCMENEGFAGSINHPARQNHRIIPITIEGQKWGFQYSPYVYYNEHCIILNSEHIPMKIEKAAFSKLFDFVRLFPHYIVGSNADLPIVGGSILSHEHFQGGNYEFAMAKAPMEESFAIKGFEGVEASIVKWPMSVIRIRSQSSDELTELGDIILQRWRSYTDESAFIYAETNGEPHNTITPIARMREGFYELDLVLRNNITTKEHPYGVYHPHEQLHHIKKENIGLIEVMGLAILPARLKNEMEQLADAIICKKEIRLIEEIEKHADWAEGFIGQYSGINEDNIMHILKDEIGKVFMQVLEHAGVYKRNEAGREAFIRFIQKI